jgi:hypothetical protein
MEWSLFLPVLLGGLAFGAISAIAGVMGGRGNEAGAERVRDAGFVLLMAMGAWIVVLLLFAAVDEPDELWDMVTIVIVIVVFFVLLLLAFFAIALLVGMLGRAGSRRKRVTTDEL